MNNNTLIFRRYNRIENYSTPSWCLSISRSCNVLLFTIMSTFIKTASTSILNSCKKPLYFVSNKTKCINECILTMISFTCVTNQLFTPLNFDTVRYTS